MARLFHAGAETGHDHSEFLTAVGTTGTWAYDTAVKRSGAFSWKATSAVISRRITTLGGALDTTYFLAIWFYVPSASGMPTTSARIVSMRTSGAAQIAAVQLATTGVVQLVDPANSQIGSDSITVTQDAWHRLDLVVRVETGATDEAYLYLDSTLVASTTTGTLAEAGPAHFVFGWITNPGASKVIHFDDLAVNNDTGSVHTTLAGDDKVVLLLPTADSATGSWKRGGNGSTDLFNDVNNTPPIGVNASDAVDGTQIFNNLSAAPPYSYDATMTTYTAAGVGGSDTVTAVYGVMEGSNNSTTGTDTLDFTGVSNPAIATATVNIDVNDDVYPTGWNRGQTVMAENPSVTLGTAPVLRVTKTLAVNRSNACCLMGLYVSYVAAAPAPSGRGPQVIWIG